MEENTVEMFDYFSVIWKRKILIIVVTLVCTGVGVAVTAVDSKVKQTLPVIYHAEAVVKIGKKVKLVPSSGASSSVVEYIEDPKDLEQMLPLRYDSKITETSGYHLDAKQVGALALVKLILKGPDRGVERVLEELVDMLADEHRGKVKDSVIVYKRFMKRLEEDVIVLKKDIVLMDKSLKEMKKKEGDYLIQIDSTLKEGETGGDRSAFMNMLYLKSIDKERELNNTRAGLRNIQRQLAMHQITLGNLGEYKTEKIGKIKSTIEKPKAENNKSTKHKIMVAGFAGLIMSLFIAFFMEYIEESKLKRKGKWQG